MELPYSIPQSTGVLPFLQASSISKENPLQLHLNVLVSYTIFKFSQWNRANEVSEVEAKMENFVIAFMEVNKDIYKLARKSVGKRGQVIMIHLLGSCTSYTPIYEARHGFCRVLSPYEPSSCADDILRVRHKTDHPEDGWG